MATKLLIRRGEGEVPTLDEGELGFRLDDKTLYIGHDDGNVQVLTGAGGAASEAETLTGLEATVEELNYLQDATGNVQIQLNALSNAIDGFSTLESPVFTGIPTVPDIDKNLEDYTNAQIANVKYVDDSIASILGEDVVETLDTIKELSEALAPLESPVFTGMPLVPDIDVEEEGFSTTQIANVNYVTEAVSDFETSIKGVGEGQELTLDTLMKIQDEFTNKADSEHNHNIFNLDKVQIPVDTETGFPLDEEADGKILKWSATAGKFVLASDDIGAGGETSGIEASIEETDSGVTSAFLKRNIVSGSKAWVWDTNTYLTEETAETDYLTKADADATYINNTTDTIAGLNVASSGVSQYKVLMADGDGTSSWQNVKPTEELLFSRTSAGAFTTSTAFSVFKEIILEVTFSDGYEDTESSDIYSFYTRERQVFPISNFSYTAVITYANPPFVPETFTTYTRNGAKITTTATDDNTMYSFRLVPNNTTLSNFTLSVYGSPIGYTIKAYGVRY